MLLAALKGRHIYKNKFCSAIIIILYLENFHLGHPLWIIEGELWLILQLLRSFGGYFNCLQKVLKAVFSARNVVSLMRLHRSNTVLRVSDTLGELE